MKISVQNGGLDVWMQPKAYYKLIKDSGFEGVDWNLDHGWSQKRIISEDADPASIYNKDMEEIIAYWQPHIDAIRENGLAFSQAHAPFPACTLAYGGSEDFLDYAIEVYKKCILLCDYVGCPRLVIHGISFRAGQARPSVEEIDGRNQKLYESLIPTLQKTNVTVCMENLFGGNHNHRVNAHCSEPREAVRFIDALNEKAGKEVFGLCLDTGHLNLMHMSFEYYIKTLGNRIKCFHIHDNDGTDDLHLAPYSGTIPWREFCSALKAIGYKGDLNFETYAQILSSRIDRELVPHFMEHIATIGKHFRNKIQN